MPRLIPTALLVLIAAADSAAQSDTEAPPPDADESLWETRIGIGAALRSEFPGADSLELRPVPIIDITYREQFFFNTGRGIGLMLLGDRSGELKYVLGGSLGLSNVKRDRKDAPDLPDVDLTGVVNIFAEVFFENWSIEATASQDILGLGHDGFVAEFRFNYTDRLNGTGRLRAGPYLRFASGDYMDAFFTIPSGAPFAPFDADGGIERIGLRALAIYPVLAHWDAVGAIDYSRLVGAAKTSPATLDADQISFFIGAAYRF